MKKMMFVLSLAACFTTSAFAAESFAVHGAQAADLWNAIEIAGAKITSVPDASFVTITQIDCTEGFMPGHGPYSNCTFNEQIPVGGMSHAIFLRKFEVNGGQATSLINALEGAGVKRVQEIELANFSVATIACSASFFGPHNGHSCTLTLAE